MPVKRPRSTTNVNMQQASRLRSKWRAWVDAAAVDIGYQLLNFETFKELRSIIAANQAIHRPGHLFEWMFTSYASAATVAIRRIDDQDSRSQSLWRVLHEALEYPGVITRESHRSLYSNHPELAGHQFNDLVGKKAKCLGPRLIRGHMRTIETSCARFRKFVNKRVAHVGSPGAIRKIPSYGDLENALGAVDQVVLYYQNLLAGSAPDTTKPVVQYDWTEVLRHPWLPKPK